MSDPASVPLGPWVKGLQNVFDSVRAPAGTLTEADNVLIGPDGIVSPRTGFDLVTTGGHSVFQHQGHVYGVYNNTLVEFLPSSARPLLSGVNAKLNWTVLNDEPVFVNNELVGRITPDGAKRFGVEEPGALVGVTATASTIKVAVSFVNEDGEEGPLSASVDSDGTVQLPQPVESTVTHIRIYQANLDSDVLYEVGQVPVGTTTFTLRQGSVYGRMTDTQYKARILGGSYARYWRGRLLVARGRTLYFSEPLRYGLYDTNSGFVRFQARIDFIEPVEGGVYVALRDIGVYFLQGESPEKWELKVADLVTAQANTSLLVPTAQMKVDLQNKPDWVAVWLTSKGFAVGLPSGTIVYPQADLLSGLPLGTGSLYFEGDRLIALSQ